VSDRCGRCQPGFCCSCDIPDFLRIPAEERRAAWERNPPTTSARTGPVAHERTETERLYYASIAYEKALKNELDRPRFAAMREKARLEKEEVEAVRERARRANKR